jgi:hypothetical protein
VDLVNAARTYTSLRLRNNLSAREHYYIALCWEAIDRRGVYLPAPVRPAMHVRSGVTLVMFTIAAAAGQQNFDHDLDAAIEAIKARCIPILMQNETPNCSMAMIHDTEGNIVVLHKRKAT